MDHKTKMIGIISLVLVFVSSVHPLTAFSQSVELASCKQSNILDATANQNNPNSPATAVLDSDSNTAWSSSGQNSWIQLDLGRPTIICGLDIQWHNIHPQQNNFLVSLSSDGVNYETILSSKSSGNTNNFEHYDFKDTLAKYVKVTVTGTESGTVTGNNIGNDVAIAGIDLFGISQVSGNAVVNRHEVIQNSIIDGQVIDKKVINEVIRNRVINEEQPGQVGQVVSGQQPGQVVSGQQPGQVVGGQQTNQCII